jgi:hypothetical protein
LGRKSFPISVLHDSFVVPGLEVYSIVGMRGNIVRTIEKTSGIRVEIRWESGVPFEKDKKDLDQVFLSHRQARIIRETIRAHGLAVAKKRGYKEPQLPAELHAKDDDDVDDRRDGGEPYGSQQGNMFDVPRDP